MLAFLTAPSVRAQDGSKKTNDLYESVAVERGWVTNYTRGREIIRELSALSPEQGRKLKVDAYRGERVAFVGVDAPPGVGDRSTENGFYLRVIYRKGKEPPKRSYIWSESMLRGTILQVLAANKIIVIEVDEEQIIQTG
jgi:hypothetical protein